MNNEQRLLNFLASEEQNDIVIDLMRFVKGIPPRRKTADLIKYVEQNKKVAQSQYLTTSGHDSNMLNRYTNWVRMLDFLTKQKE